MNPARAVLLSTLLPFAVACVAGCGPVERAAPPVEPGPVDADAKQEFTRTESGLEYRIRRRGPGDEPNADSVVTVHYRGWLDDETVFDESYRRGEPLTISMQRVVPGWTEGLQLVAEGGMIELRVPSELGYGPQGKGNIPPDAQLHFLVELLHFD